MVLRSYFLYFHPKFNFEDNLLGVKCGVVTLLGSLGIQGYDINFHTFIPTLHTTNHLDSDSPPEEADGLVVQVELLCLGVSPLVAEHKHDPGVQLSQGPGHVTLASLVENCADQPEIKGVTGQGEDVPAMTINDSDDSDHYNDDDSPPVRPGPVLQCPAGADL